MWLRNLVLSGLLVFCGCQSTSNQQSFDPGPFDSYGMPQERHGVYFNVGFEGPRQPFDAITRMVQQQKSMELEKRVKALEAKER